MEKFVHILDVRAARSGQSVQNAVAATGAKCTATQVASVVKPFKDDAFRPRVARIPAPGVDLELCSDGVDGVYVRLWFKLHETDELDLAVKRVCKHAKAEVRLNNSGWRKPEVILAGWEAWKKARRS